MELQDADDAALVLALRAGDPRAPRVLWDRYSATVFRILNRTMGPSNDIEDAAQEVFLTVFRKADEIKNPGALRAYIMTVATMTSRSELRKRRSHRRGDASDTNVPTTVLDTEARAALVRFHTLLDQLRPTLRAAFVLRFVECHELTEVAAALGVSLATAKRHIALASARVQLYVERDPLLATYGAGAA